MTEFNNRGTHVLERLLVQRLVAARSNQRGTTLVEMLIVILIMSILSVGMVYLMTALFNSFTQGNQRYLQQTEQGTVVDFFQSKTAGVSASSDLALYEGNGAVNPVSYAGDQIVFTAHGVCYRIFYLGYKRQLRAAASSDGCGSIAPVRGPNQEVAGGGYVETNPSAPDRDPVLDDLDGGTSFVLASNVTLSDGSTTPTGLNAPLRYYSADGRSQYENDGAASSDSSNPFYEDSSAVRSTGEIQLEFQVGAPIEGAAMVPPQPFKLTLYLDR